MGGTHWTCVYIKDIKSHCFHSFAGYPDRFLLQPLPKPITFHIVKVKV